MQCLGNIFVMKYYFIYFLHHIHFLNLKIKIYTNDTRELSPPIKSNVYSGTGFGSFFQKQITLFFFSYTLQLGVCLTVCLFVSNKRQNG